MEMIVIGLAICLLFARACAVDGVRNDFEWGFEFYPEGIEVLPSPMAMLYHPRYQHLWTTAQWVKWVKAQGVKK